MEATTTLRAADDRQMSLRVLGPLQVVGPRGVVAVPAGHQQRLLAWLIMYVNRPCSVARLVDVVWNGPEAAPVRPRRELRMLLRHLAENLTALGAWIRIELDDDAATLRAPPLSVDAQQFTDLVTTNRRWVPPEWEAALDSALALWRGEPYPELADLPDALPEIGRLQDLHLGAIEALNGLAFRGPVDYFLVARLRVLVAEHPERERLWCQLAQAEYCTGRRAEALRTLERWRRERALSGQRQPPAAMLLEHAILNRDVRLNDREVGVP